MLSPTDAVIAVTHRCNARCVMCNVWKREEPDRLAPEHMRRLPVSLKTVNLSGGEPFLREDLPEFVREIRRRCPRAVITISTNAFLCDRIESMMDEIPRIDPTVRLAVSLDGLGDVHDNIRGVPGAYEKAITLIGRLRAKRYGGLRLSMTLSRGNLEQLCDVAELADQLGVELGVLAAHGVKTHLEVEPGVFGDFLEKPAWLHEPFEAVISRWLKSSDPRRWMRAHFAAWTYYYLTDRPWRYTCRAGEDFFFLQADGCVYHCSVQGKVMGNIIDQPWEAFWYSPTAEEARKAARNCPEHCWMICTVRSVYRKKVKRILLWILWAKFRAHLGRFRLKRQKK
ncbi:MAG: radical SAM protein [Phycisphaerae bacterium]|nr:radical SAM protein [Phycisphaerae bacterium]